MTAYYLDAHADRPVAHVGPPRGLHRVVVDVDDLVQVPRHVARDLRQLLEVEVPAQGLGHLNIGLRETLSACSRPPSSNLICQVSHKFRDRAMLHRRAGIQKVQLQSH